MTSSEPTLPPENPPAVPAVEPAVEPAPRMSVQPQREPPPARPGNFARYTVMALVLLAGLALLSSLMLWQRLGAIQEQLARQSADSGAAAIEARALARQAQDLARDNAARQAVLETRLSEVALQRTQLEDLMQSLSRSRDENLVIDVESALRLAQQQMQLTGSAEPLIAALRTADGRLARAAQPRLARARAAVARDIERLRTASLTDVPGVLARLDELVRQIDDLPVANAVPRPTVEGTRKPPAAPGAGSREWWQRILDSSWEEARSLLRVSRIDRPEAALLAPEQAYFVRENLKLKLLNARLSLLARQTDSARTDVVAAAAALQKYFDPGSRRVQAVAAQLQQVQAAMRGIELPRIDETLAALATAGAGR